MSRCRHQVCKRILSFSQSSSKKFYTFSHPHCVCARCTRVYTGDGAQVLRAHNGRILVAEHPRRFVECLWTSEFSMLARCSRDARGARQPAKSLRLRVRIVVAQDFVMHRCFVAGANIMSTSLTRMHGLVGKNVNKCVGEKAETWWF